MSHQFSPEAIMNSPEKAELVAAIEEAKSKHEAEDPPGTGGKIVCGKRVYSHWEGWQVKTQERLKRLSEQRQRDLGFAKLCGARVSQDQGKTWKLYALCDKCMADAEPPTRIRIEGSAGALNCDWCGAYNEEFRGKL